MNKKTGRVLLSSMASTAISLSLLYATAMLYNNSIIHVFELALAVLAVRLIQGSRGTSATAVARGNINTVLIRTIVHETKFTVGLLAACFLFQWQLSSKKVIVLGTGELAKEAVNGALDNIESDIAVIGFLDFRRTGMWSYRDIPLMGHPEQLKTIISQQQVDCVIVAVEIDELSQAKESALLAEQMGVTVVVMSQIFDLRLSRHRAVEVGNIPAVEYSCVPAGKISLSFKRLSDSIGALVGLVLFAPIMIVAAIAIKIDSRGPVLFRQTRSGINGKTFKLWKFRTMVIDAEKKKAELLEKNEMSGPVFKMTGDPRITRVGHFLRKYSIDEFPQFMNVLTGEMSLVGPRPALPSEVAGFEPWQHRKLSVKPGLTCLWQADGRNDIDFEDWMKMDLEYIDNWSVWEDTKIIAKTIPAVLKGSGK